MLTEYKIAKEVFKLARIVLWLMLIIGTILILKFFASLLKPLVVAVVFWYIIRVMSNFFTRFQFGKFKVPDWAAKAFSFVFIVVMIYTFVDIIAINLSQIVFNVEHYNTR